MPWLLPRDHLPWDSEENISLDDLLGIWDAPQDEEGYLGSRVLGRSVAAASPQALNEKMLHQMALVRSMVLLGLVLILCKM